MTHRQNVGHGMTKFVSFLIVMAMLAACAVAQSTSAVRGSIADPQGSVVANATVTLTNADTNQTRTQKTGAGGTFTFDLLKPGSYTLKVEAAGFRTLERPVEALVARPS